MLSILKTASVASTSLNYSVNTTIPLAYQQSPWQPDTALHLLLQNSDGSYALLLWNDVSSSSLTDSGGNTLSGTARDISVADFSTTLSFATPMDDDVTMYGLDPFGTTAATTLDTSDLTIEDGQLTVQVPDYVEILELRPVSLPEPSSVGLLALSSVALLSRRRSVNASNIPPWNSSSDG